LQRAVPAAVCNPVIGDTPLYPVSATQFAQVSTSNDNVSRGSTAAQIASRRRPSRSVAAGYAASALIGVAR